MTLLRMCDRSRIALPGVQRSVLDMRQKTQQTRSVLELWRASPRIPPRAPLVPRMDTT